MKNFIVLSILAVGGWAKSKPPIPVPWACGRELEEAHSTIYYISLLIYIINIWFL